MFLSLAGCGGGGTPNSGGGGSPTPTPTPDFSLSVSPTSITVSALASAVDTATIAGVNGFSGTAAVQFSNLPQGVTVSPTSANLTAGGSASFTFSATSGASAGSFAVLATATSGSLSHSTQLSVTVAQQAPVTNGKLGRTKYLRTDAVTEYGYWLNTGWAVYHAPTRRFFVSDLSGNKISVLDANTETLIATIPVPGAYGIDLTPDNSTLYAGTQIGDVYAIDPVAMTVVRRYPAYSIGPMGFGAYVVKVLASGQLALLGGQGGIPSVDGFSQFAVWAPSTNALTAYTTGYGAAFSIGGIQPIDMCPGAGNIGQFILSGDRTRIIISSIDSDSTICSFDPVSGNHVAATGTTEFIYQLATTPDGSALIEPSYSPAGITVFDAKTLVKKNFFSVGGDTASDGALFVSNDSKTLYMNGEGALYAYDLGTGSLTGWSSVPVVSPTTGGLSTGPNTQVNPKAMDETGLIFGPMEEGVGFVDTKVFQTGKVAGATSNGYLTPPSGPVSGGTSVQWNGYYATGVTVTSAYFGTNAATGVSAGSHAVTPPGPAGPVDFYAYLSDGGIQIFPEAYSYGPTIVQATPDSTTAEGGSTGVVFGYGFSTATGTAIPSSLQVSVGGHPAVVTGFTSNAYGQSGPPFPLQAFSFTFPAGVASTSSDLSVTSATGSTTLSGGIHYLPAVQNFPLQNAVLAQGIYDSKRDLYYFSDASSVRVFSRAQKNWQTSLSVPAPAAGSTRRLWSMSLSPDGSKLAIADPGTDSVILVDPDGVSPAKVLSSVVPSGVPGGIALSDSGMVYIAASISNGTGYSMVFKLDSSTGKVTSYKQLQNSSASGSDINFHLAISRDNKRVYFNEQGQLLYIDTTSDELVYAPVGPSCCYGDYDLHLANNQTSLEATSYLYDGDTHALSYLTLNDREALDIGYVDGTAYSPDGSLMFQPSTNGIDVFDGRFGILRNRIALPFALAQNYDALVANGPDNLLVAITGQTGTGISLVDLRQLQEPAPITYPNVERANALPSLFNPSTRFSGTSTTPKPNALPFRRVPHVSNADHTSVVKPEYRDIGAQPLK